MRYAGTEACHFDSCGDFSSDRNTSGEKCTTNCFNSRELKVNDGMKPNSRFEFSHI